MCNDMEPEEADLLIWRKCMPGRMATAFSYAKSDWRYDDAPAALPTAYHP